jgi:hypothetical protein
MSSSDKLTHRVQAGEIIKPWLVLGPFYEDLSAPIEADGDMLAYESPSIGRFVTGWDATPTVGGEPIQLHGYPLVDSPWAHADFGSGELAIRYGDEVYEIWFDQ